MPSPISALITAHRPDLAPYEDLYKHFHANPELSNQERETAATIATHLHDKISTDWDIHPHIGGHGLAAVLSNGAGPTIALRADTDALPIFERTNLPYASTKHMPDADGNEKPVMHACGHDMHITSLLAAAHTLTAARAAWSGTVILIFQPAEERGTGARAMVEDGLYSPGKHGVPVPDIVLGAHVVPWRSGTIGTRRGLIATSADSLRVTLHGRGGHASQPHRLVDPVVMAASTIMRLQGIVSREVDPWDTAVVTVASVQAGDAENVVVDDAQLAIDVRAARQGTREKVLGSVRRILEAEAVAGRAVRAPTVTTTRTFPVTVNDVEVTARLEETFAAHFGTGSQAYTSACEALCGSEDFSLLASLVGRPYCFFLYGGTETGLWDRCEKAGTVGEEVPINHSGLFAPVVGRTLEVGVEGYVVGALTFLGGSEDGRSTG